MSERLGNNGRWQLYSPGKCARIDVGASCLSVCLMVRLRACFAVSPWAAVGIACTALVPGVCVMKLCWRDGPE